MSQVAYRIQRLEAVGRAAKRIIRGELDEALRKARDAALTVDERVHEVRTGLKRARAVVRLVEAEGGRPARRDDRRLRDIGRGLAPSRDLFATLQAIGRIAKPLGRRGDAAAKARHATFARRLRRALAGADAASGLSDGVRQLERARQKVCGWKVARDRRAIGAGFERSYRRARRAFRRVRVDDDAARFHAWRKAVKRLGYQSVLLGEASPTFLGTLDPLLRRLGRLLGDLHDLALLHAAVVDHGGGDLRREREQWIALLAERSLALRHDCRVLGATLFGERPALFRRRVDECWVAWRASPDGP